MPLYNRERDFTEATISTLRENLKGETEPYNEFQQWMNEHADAFKDTSFSDDLLSVDRYMTELREFNETALHELNRMERAVHEADERFASQCKETAAELKSYSEKIDILNKSLRSVDFIAAFAAFPAGATNYLASSEAAQVITDPALRELANWLLAMAGLAPWVDGPLPFGDIVAALLLLVLLGILTYQFVQNCIEYFSSGTSAGTTITVTLPVLTADMITQAVNDLDNANTKRHILQGKHGWNKMFPDPNNNWKEIKAIIKMVLTYGAVEQNGKTEDIVKYTYQIGEFFVVVTGRWIDGIFRIADAWIK